MVDPVETRQPQPQDPDHIGQAARKAASRLKKRGPAAGDGPDLIRKAARRVTNSPPPPSDTMSRPPGPSTADRDRRRAERAKQALLGLLASDRSSEGSGPASLDARRLDERLNRMSPEEMEKMADLLSLARTPGGTTEPGQTGPIDQLDAKLAGRGIKLEMRGQNNTVYIAGDHPTWHVEQAPGGPGNETPQTSPPWKGTSRAPGRNIWGSQLGRQVKNFINGH
jgi:hypothetical protein